jgi:3-oxoacyl-[acyl-carrier protein] reductase
MKRNVLVTGSSSGIGKSIFQKFCKDKNYRVFGLGSRKSKINNFFSVDFSNPENIIAIKDRIKNLNFDILINCAGVNSNDNFENLNIKKIQLVHNVNFLAPFLISQIVIKNMKRKKWGRIVNITSIFAEKVRSNRVSYITSKYALNALSKSIAIDYAKYNILSNSVAPGIIDTRMTNKMLKRGANVILKKVPLGKLGKTSDISNLVFFLCSEENKFITGQQYIVDGGYTIS